MRVGKIPTIYSGIIMINLRNDSKQCNIPVSDYEMLISICITSHREAGQTNTLQELSTSESNAPST
jgi:hypothetical protein